ncbi:MAG: dihydroorotase [Gammaproteobacteria bacterium CG_4_10_14_0_8_um_filter_38_16]|nr:MAG: dihydroorotase [Gammaproteobacteria bacterium CG_4_10_14_0_8_um_filter_38_16]PJA03888.1 MAG: dihydroorotase [Gammaproteobacteria bacterium CG_4_10_14_0_2_um_filter_38_22]PJB09498.1 MAG: dihydroorotase [Gammaproteobacteria bacterium CG_4_9_14_3_um_filter_38_9]
MNNLLITQPDDWHCHLRDDAFLKRTVADTARQFARAIVMPNLKLPITTIAQAHEYRSRIISNIPTGLQFEPLMTLYLTDTLSSDLFLDAKKSGIIVAAKYYPAGATTLSDSGILNIKTIYPLLEAMQSADLPLCIHGESIEKDVDIFDREKLFLTTLKTVLTDFPKLRIILEHISTSAAVEFIQAAPNNIAATITPHHLHYNRNDLFRGGIHPHYFCMPILKHTDDQQALIKAAISGNPKFFLGTDSAPHTRDQKEAACGCAGIYSAHAAIELYADIFERNHALNKLENFASVFGAAFYQLPINKNKITLIKKPWKIKDALSFGNTELIPMKAGEMLSWQIQF